LSSREDRIAEPVTGVKPFITRTTSIAGNAPLTSPGESSSPSAGFFFIPKQNHLRRRDELLELVPILLAARRLAHRAFRRFYNWLHKNLAFFPLPPKNRTA
jgi:hypothetical protein